MNYTDRLQRVIPGGAHTYSKGFDQFPSNAPQILERGEGVYVYEPGGKKYLDFGMGLRSVLIGYSENEIDRKAIHYLKLGMNLTRPSLIELEAAELMVSLIPGAEMVKFTKNGSTAVSAAVKLARAYTQKNLIAICSDHPFFSYDDWFIATTPMSKGIPPEVSLFTKSFRYNDIESLKKLIEIYPNEIACVVLEPQATDCPAVSDFSAGCCSKMDCSRVSYESNFLQEVQEVCNKNGIVFILDEMITGFRWGLSGAQGAFKVRPDLSTFGKAIANGFPLACVVGKREIMSLGSIDKIGEERLFLVSTTHGGDMASFGAFKAMVEFMKREPVVKNVWNFGFNLISAMNKLILNHGLQDFIKVMGPACSPKFITLDQNKNSSFEFRTLFVQELIKCNILMPWISIAYRHSTDLITDMSDGLDSMLDIYSKALQSNPRDFVHGDFIKPVFRKFN
jgi:glutamate-1-semialdehyde 2,1-aminomutase